MENYGIENLKMTVTAVCNFVRQTEQTAQQGWKWTSIFSFADEAMEISDVAKKWNEVKQEFKDLSPEERAQLVEHIIVEFDMANDAAERAVEHAVSWIDNTINLANELRAL